MSVFEDKSGGLRYLLVRFSIVTVVTIIGLALIKILLFVFFPYDGNGGNFVAAMVPGLDAGQAYARRFNRKPANGEAWCLAVLFTGLSTLISFGLLFLFNAFTSENILEVLSQLSTSTIAIIFATVTIVYLLLIRLFMGLGARATLKHAAKVAAKDQ